MSECVDGARFRLCGCGVRLSLGVVTAEIHLPYAATQISFMTGRSPPRERGSKGC